MNFYPNPDGPANHAHKSDDLNTVEYNNQYEKHKIATNC